MRGIIGVVVAFLIWDATAWPAGPTFLLWVSVLLVVGAAAEDALKMVGAFFIGNFIGAVVGIAALYLLLPLSGRFEWLALVIVAFTGIGVWAETFGPTAGYAVGFCNGLLQVGMTPANPQVYNLNDSIETALGLTIGMGFGLILFALIGTPGSNRDRVNRALNRMRREADMATRRGLLGRKDRFATETRMYEDLGRVQAAKGDAADQRTAVDLLLACRAALGPRHQPSACPGS